MRTLTQLQQEIERGFEGEMVPYTRILVEDVKMRGRKRNKKALKSLGKD